MNEKPNDKPNVKDDGTIIMGLDESSRAFITAQVDRIIAALGSRPASSPTNTGGQRANRTTAPSGSLPTELPNYGKSKGAPIYGASAEDLDYYANGCRKSLADKAKARFHDKERAMLAAIEAEIQRQSGPPRRNLGQDMGPPPPGFDDPQDTEVPF